MGIANEEYEDKLLFTTLMAIDYIKRMDECGYIVRYLSTDKEDNAIGNPFSSCFLLANNLIDNEVYTSVGYDIFRLPCGNNPEDVNHEIVKLQGDIFHALEGRLLSSVILQYEDDLESPEILHFFNF